ncbi:hypothetical protein I6N91_10955 [Arthrobacter sp. MSA 4-2]|uniref:hypothetical protein n=1 Tax=Arthrobacter sp. MSA 4-2 TaxID=2794349 RepID=UPI0018E7BCBB|nr:hypothetical protein [Arthrobacter sp. MSA 4-2]MBJ2121496.1 hypothetical protein [Arthrobacter sp. MSA 4-2]
MSQIGSHHPWWLNVLMIVMVAVCLPCAVHIWRRPTTPVLHQVMISALSMAVLHAGLMLAPGTSAPPDHSHGNGSAAASQVTDAANEQTLGVIGLEIGTAMLASTLVARIRSNVQRTAAAPNLPQAHEAGKVRGGSAAGK